MMISCNDFDIADQGFDLESLPGYVAFDAPGENSTLDDIEVDEDEGTVTVTIESPTGTLVNITIDYTFGGNAVFGVDFDVAGATASGGTIVLEVDPTDVQNLDNVDLDVEILEDGVADGEKTLTISLASAIDADGNSISVGRGGTDFLKTATIIISDID